MCIDTFFRVSLKSNLLALKVAASSIKAPKVEVSNTQSPLICHATAVQHIDIYYPDTVLPIHIAWHDEVTAKSTTKYGRRQFTLKTATSLLRSA